MRKLKAAEIPHSWGIETWPEPVFPRTPQRARHVLRKYRDQLIAAGALRKIGREWVILGDAYCRWIVGHVEHGDAGRPHEEATA